MKLKILNKSKKKKAPKVKAEKVKKTKKIDTTKKKKKINVKAIILGSILTIAILLTTSILLLGLYVILTAPDFNKELLYEKEATIIYDVNGNELMRTGENNIELVSYEELPQVLIDAIVATEDSRFFQHTGLDAPRFAVATIGQLLGNDEAGGASTLSMQVVKNTYTDASETSGISGIIRKLTDVYMSIFKLESSYTKEEIIEFYVNSQWLGNDNNVNYTGITGVEQGSEYLFGKSVTELTLAEASLLAGMFQAPDAHNPYKNPESARSRQEIVLTLMVRHGYISEDEKEAVLDVPVESLLKEQSETTSNYLQAPIDYVLEEVRELTKSDANPDGLNPYYVPMKIYTTIDPNIQQILHKVETGESYDIPDSYGNLQFGMAITSMENGSIVAMSGGVDYQPTGTNRADVRRQPGSTAKPIFAFGPHIEYLNSSPSSFFLDEAANYTGGTAMRNWDNQFWGEMTMKDALVASRNIPALLAFQQVAEVDLGYIEDFVHNLGIDYGTDLYESASIGGFDGVSPIELSAAYAAFGRDGYYIEPYSVTKVSINDSEEVIEHKYTKERAMSAETAYLVNNMLVGSGVSGIYVSGTDLAAKTGTSTIDAKAAESLGIPSWAIMDNWVTSYNPEYSFSTWIGYDKLSSEYYLTSALAGPVRNGLSKAVGEQIYNANQRFTNSTANIVTVQVEKSTYPLQLAGPNTPEEEIISAQFKSGTQPTEVSSRYDSLEDVTNLKSTYDGKEIKLTWDKIKTPDYLNPTFLTEYFNEYYGDHAAKYYEARINYNNSYMGDVIYDIYLDTNGTLTLIGSTATNSFTYDEFKAGETQNFVVVSSLTKYKQMESDGVKTKITTTADSNVDDAVTDGTEEESTKPETESTP